MNAKHPSRPHAPPRYLSLRWRLTLPVFVTLTIGALLIAVSTSNALTQHLQTTQRDQLREDTERVRAGLLAFTTTQRDTVKLLALLSWANPEALRNAAEALAGTARLDYVFFARSDLTMLLGIERSDRSYQNAEPAALGSLGFVRQAVNSAQSTAGIVQTRRGYALLTAYPIRAGAQITGVVVGGVAIKDAAFALQAGHGALIAIHGPNGELLFNPFQDIADSQLTYRLPLPVNPETTLMGTHYALAYLPLMVEGSPLGTLALYQVQSWVTATESGRMLLAGGLCLLTISTLSLLYLLVSHQIRRIERMTGVARGLLHESPNGRTALVAGDELGELGVAFDQFTDQQQAIRQHLHQALNRQSGEIRRLETLYAETLEALQDQDTQPAPGYPLPADLFNFQEPPKPSPPDPLSRW